MNILAGLLLLPLLMAGGSYNSKIDTRLLKKTKTLGPGSNKMSAIVFSQDKKEPVCKDYLEKMGVKIKYELPLIHAYAVEIPGSKLEEMARSEVVKYISDDAKMNSLLNVATRGIEAKIVNDKGYKGKNIGIAILDTGVYPHPDLVRPKNRIVAFRDFVNKRNAPYDDNGHGTFVAGAAAGNGYMSDGKYSGVAPEANIIGVKVMDAEGSGSSSDIIAGMQWVVDNKEKYNICVMSLSLGASPSNNYRNDALAVAVDEVWKRGIVVVAAAGNSGPKQATITTPGISPTIITVGAVDDKRTPDIKDDTIADFSSRGPAIGRVAKPDVVAPGVDVVSLNTDKSYRGGDSRTNLENDYRKMSGTSVATPIVSGAVALMIEKNSDLSPNRIKESIIKSCRTLNKNRLAQGSGIIDVRTMMNVK